MTEISEHNIGFSEPRHNDSAHFDYRQLYLVCTGPAAGPRFKKINNFFSLAPTLTSWGRRFPPPLSGDKVIETVTDF